MGNILGFWAIRYSHRIRPQLHEVNEQIKHEQRLLVYLGQD